MIIRRISTGSMTMDTNERLVSPSDYVLANDICKEATQTGNDGTPSSTPGNSLIAFTGTEAPSGINTVIFAKADNYRERIYFFIYNSAGYHQIRYYTKSTGIITKLLQDKTDTGNAVVLNFSLSNPITACDIIYRDDVEGDILCFTDGYNPPRKINVLNMLGKYGGLTVTEEMITLAKTPPLSPAVVTYKNDTSRNTNNLRKKLYQFKYRWVYDDYEKSTWSPITDVPVPGGISNNDNDLDPTYNNYIEVKVTTGSVQVKKIEVAVRESSGSEWNDFVMAESLDKTFLSISNGTEYSYSFYNDNLYPPIDLTESNMLFDYVPKLAKAQCLVNGNVLLYGAITEGYPNLNKSSLNVSMTVTTKKNTGTDAGPSSTPSLTSSLTNANYVTGVMTYTITVGSYVELGTVYKIIISSSGYTTVQYTSIAGDTQTSVVNSLYNLVPPSMQGSLAGGTGFTVLVPNYGFITQVSATPQQGEIATSSVWNWSSKYRFGIVYFDEKGRSNGVESFVSKTDTTTDFEVNTPVFTHDTGTPKTPVISASISHTPPTWAKKFMWVRTKNLTYDRFIYYITSDFQSDSNYYYFSLENIARFKNANSNFNYADAGIVAGDRIRIVCNATAVNSGYGSTYYHQDYEILGIVQRASTISAGTNIDFIKVKAPVTSVAFTANSFVMVYTPSSATTSAENSVFFEFSDSYDIYTDGSGNRLHMGMLANQTVSTPATFSWENGDIYYHIRQIMTTSASASNIYTYKMPDINFSDFYKSSVNSNGRPWAIDINAREVYLPTLVRFSQEYVSYSNINNVNRFMYDNQDIYNRAFGDIVKLVERDKTIRVFQRYKIGMVPVYQQIIKDAVGTENIAVSDRLLNYIQYYQGDYGAGFHPSAIASEEFADYFVDTRKGAICRIGRDGVTPISALYKVNNWSTDNLTVRNSYSNKIYGCFDKKLNRFVLSLESVSGFPAKTISFHEPSNSFEAFHSFIPEFMVTLGVDFVSFKNGGLWIHNNESTYCNFYGVQYTPSITISFNDGIDVKKTFIGISVLSNGNSWYCPDIETPTGQYSYINNSSFVKKEDMWHSPIFRDDNSSLGILSGDRMKGNYILVKLQPSNPSSFNCLTLAEVNYIVSNKIQR